MRTEIVMFSSWLTVLYVIKCDMKSATLWQALKLVHDGGTDAG